MRRLPGWTAGVQGRVRINGFDALNALKEKAALNGTRFIALSADALPVQIEKALDAGFDHYLTKPIDIDQLISELESLK